MRNTHGINAKRELHDRLARLAYKFSPECSTEGRFRMMRTPALDKVPH